MSTELQKPIVIPILCAIFFSWGCRESTANESTTSALSTALCQAGTAITTSRGKVFTCEANPHLHPAFQGAWRDPQGKLWSKTLGLYRNEDLDQSLPPVNGVIQKSAATEACIAIGGRLPGTGEHIALLDNFENSGRYPYPPPSPRSGDMDLSAPAIGEFYRIFSDSHERGYWSSSIAQSGGTFSSDGLVTASFRVSIFYSYSSMHGWRHQERGVRCIYGP